MQAPITYQGVIEVAGKNHHVFVYGTLKRGLSNHGIVSRYIASVTPAAVRGWLYDLGYYPAMAEGSGWVYGELIELMPEFADKAFVEMDLLEGVNQSEPSLGLYERATVAAHLANGETVACETYRMPKRKNFSLDDLLPGGVWPKDSAEERIPYIAYGSCMCEDSFAETVSDYHIVGRVEIPGYRVGFTRYSERRSGGVADLMEARGRTAEGILYLVSASQLQALDRREGAPTFYRRFTLPVICEGLLFPAMSYEVVHKMKQEVPPHPNYIQLILNGAAALSPAYVKDLHQHIDMLVASGAKAKGAI
jgi:gamma-glutamylcyclotransferase (GGCT)/AIG2-like uncharacterized protein YtfP/cation transport regulator ChaC